MKKFEVILNVWKHTDENEIRTRYQVVLAKSFTTDSSGALYFHDETDEHGNHPLIALFAPGIWQWVREVEGQASE